MWPHPNIMSDENAVFLFVTGAGTCRKTPEIIEAIVSEKFKVYSVLTPNVAQVTAPAPLMEVPGNNWIHAYLQDPLDRYPFGTMVVAPCTFNSFNKIALGLADNLAMSMIADGLGAGNRLIIAPSMNHGLWSHPQTKASLKHFEEWGCEVVPPTINEKQVTMAPIEAIVKMLLKGN